MGRDGLKILTKDVFLFKQLAVNEQGQSIGYYTATGHVPNFIEEFKLKGLEIDRAVFQAKDEKAMAQELLGDKEALSR